MWKAAREAVWPTEDESGEIYIDKERNQERWQRFTTT